RSDKPQWASWYTNCTYSVAHRRLTPQQGVNTLIIKALLLLRQGCGAGFGLAPAAVPEAGAQGGPDERLEQRVRRLRARFELRVELAADEIGVLRQLDHLHQAAVGRRARDEHAVAGQRLAVVVVDLVAMAVPLADLGGAVRGGGLRTRGEHARIRAEAHRRALLGHAPLFWHQIDHRVRRLRVELGRIGAAKPGDVAR